MGSWCKGVIIYTSDGGVNCNPQVSNTADDLYSVTFMDEDNEMMNSILELMNAELYNIYSNWEYPV